MPVKYKGILIIIFAIYTRCQQMNSDQNNYVILFYCASSYHSKLILTKSLVLVLIITMSFLSLRIIVSLKINTTITTNNTHTLSKITTITTYNNYVISFTAYHRILVKITDWKVDGYSIIAPNIAICHTILCTETVYIKHCV